MQPGSGCATRFRVCNQVRGVQLGSWCATRFRVCNQDQGVQPGSGCATRFRVCNQVQGVQPGSGCATRIRVCNQIQDVQPGSGCATRLSVLLSEWFRYRLRARLHNIASTIYMPLLFGSYRDTAVLLGVLQYRGMTRKVGAYI